MLRTQSRKRSTRRPNLRRSKKTKQKPVWQEVLQIAETIPEPDLHKLPTDLAEKHDQYLYGRHRG
jgi:hypothetical protein